MDPQVQVPAVPQACGGTGLGMDGAVSSQPRKDQSYWGPDTKSSGRTLAMQKLAGQEGKQMMVSIQGALSLHPSSLSACSGKDSISSAERSWQGACPPSAFGSPQVRSVSWEPVSVELSSGLLML